MDRAAANTLRTLGIVLTSIILIIACGFLLLLSICAGLLGQTSQDHTVAFEFFLAAVLVLVFGILVIAKLSRAIARDTEPQPTPSILAPPPITPTFVLDSPPPPAPPTPTQPTPPTSAFPAPLPSTYAPESARVSTQVNPAHFSSASREAIQNLIYAIAAVIAINLLYAILPAFGITLLHTNVPRPNPFAFVPRFGVVPYILISSILNVAPYIVLLVALRRAPGPRAFAYALVVPAIPAAWGILSLPLLLLSIFRLPGSLLTQAFLLAVPVALDCLIFYFAWIAISRTGIHPPPKRLIIASVVILIYRLFVVAAVVAAVIPMTSKLFGH